MKSKRRNQAKRKRELGKTSISDSTPTPRDFKKVKKQVVIVEWEDARDHARKSFKEVPMNPLNHCEEVGYLIEKNKHHVLLCHSYDSDDGESNDFTAIPTPWVTKMRYLKEIS